MKGYNKKLKNFIEYIFDKYAEDENVHNFQCVYFDKEREKEERKKAKQLLHIMANPIKISRTTASICIKIIKCEITKNELLSNYTNGFMDRLQNAHNELQIALGVING